VDVARDRLWEQAGERNATMIGLFTLAPKKVVSVVVPREWEKAMRRLIWVILTCIMMAGDGQAQTAKIVGLGATGCREFIAETTQNPALQRDYLAWVQGFMSGLLLSRPPGVDEGLNLAPSTFPLLKQLEFLRDYCIQNASDRFTDAILSLYRRLRKESATLRGIMYRGVGIISTMSEPLASEICPTTIPRFRPRPSPA
jgi:hypothetical protein